MEGVLENDGLREHGFLFMVYVSAVRRSVDSEPRNTPVPVRTGEIISAPGSDLASKQAKSHQNQAKLKKNFPPAADSSVLLRPLSLGQMEESGAA